MKMELLLSGDDDWPASAHWLRLALLSLAMLDRSDTESLIKHAVARADAEDGEFPVGLNRLPSKVGREDLAANLVLMAKLIRGARG